MDKRAFRAFLICMALLLSLLIPALSLEAKAAETDSAAVEVQEAAVSEPEAVSDAAAQEESAPEEPDAAEPAAEEASPAETAEAEAPAETPQTEPAKTPAPAAQKAQSVSDAVSDAAPAAEDEESDGWHEDDTGFYYLEDGERVRNTVRQIDGAWYGFNSMGYRWEDCTFSAYNSDDVYCSYRAREDGTLYAGQWLEEDGYKYYFNASAEMLKELSAEIDGSWYGFDRYGRLQLNRTFSIYDSSLGRSVYYRAREDGTLYVNTWYNAGNDEYPTWYYYGEGGKAPYGVATIDGKQYLFNSGGALYTNGSWTDNTGSYVSDAEGIAVKLENGWTQAGDYWYYAVDGVMVKNEVRQIGENWYGFDGYGRMRTGTTFNIYENDIGRRVYYRAKADGPLYVNEWYNSGSEENPNWYYYGEGGRSAYNIMTVGDKQYLFDNYGCLRRNSAYTDGTGEYASDENGVAVLLSDSDGWKKVGDQWYYRLNGSLVKSKAVQIKGVWYGFDSNGCMYHGTSFYYYNDTVDKYCYSRAKDDGPLYVNEWYESGYSRYYYGENGVAASGLTTVDGTTYLFDSNGAARRNDSTTIDGVLYLTDNLGVAYAVKDNSWNHVGDYWYYCRDGVLLKSQVAQIGSSWYGFDYNGRMYADSTFDFYENNRWVYYRAKADGKLYVNSWYNAGSEENPNWYYYGEGGKAPYGPYTVGGKTYLFSSDGRLNRGGSWDGEEGRYVSDENGVAYALKDNGWTKAGSYWYYSEDGALVTSAVRQLGGKWYGFNSNGRMYTSTSFSVYNSELNKSEYFRAKEDGTLYINEWYNRNSYYPYYYGENGVGVSGLVTLDGKTYLFDYDGELLKNNSRSVNEVLYVSDSDGVAYRVNFEGWTQAGTNWYYSEVGTLVKNGVRQIDGKWYGFDYNGRMYTDTSFSFYDYNLGVSSYYRAKADGTLYADEWYTAYNGKYYYGSDAKAPSGIASVNGKDYLFYYNGSLRTNDYLIDDTGSYVTDAEGVVTKLKANGWTQANGYWYYTQNDVLVRSEVRKIGGKWYGFESNGRMYTDAEFRLYQNDVSDWCSYRAKADGVLYTSEWYDDGRGYASSRYYYGADARGFTGVQTVDGKVYIFNSNGSVASNVAMADAKGNNYVADADGNTKLMKANGWTSASNYWYYTSNGRILRSEAKQIGGSWYGFNEFGQMITNATFYVYDADIEKDVYYRAKEDGTLYVNEWYHNGRYDYYYGADAKALRGVQTVDGKQYLFDDDGRMNTDRAMEVDGTYYAADVNGVVTKFTGNGWRHIGTKWYYLESGTPLSSTAREIKGSWYAFLPDYSMLTDSAEELYNKDLGTWQYYRAKADGTLYAGEWYESGSTRYYYSDNGRAANGLQTVDGKQYYFNYDGSVARNTTFSSNGAWYVSDQNGDVVRMPDNGWKKVDANWYYMVNREMIRTRSYQIKDKWYVFDSDGRMVTDRTYGINSRYYRAKADGTLYVNSWYNAGTSENPEWYYYGAEGASLSGLQTVGGKQYIFSSTGRMTTNDSIESGGAAYASDASGAVTKLPANGWKQVGDYWYYTVNNRLSTGLKEIKGSLYYFSSNGHMYDDTSISFYDSTVSRYVYYRAKEGGKLYVNEWYQFGGNRYYYGEGGRGLIGLQTVDGKQYYFESARAITDTYLTYDGLLYQANSSGALTKVTKDGLYRGVYNGGTMYLSGGKVLTNSWKQVSGSWYYFSDSGSAFSGMRAIKDKFYYFNVNNVMQSKGWIHTGSSVFYAGSDGALLTGEQKIDGKWYYFNENGYMQTGIVEYNDNVYFYGVDGVYVGKAKNGWNQFEGGWYYVQNGEAVYNTVMTIKDKDYAFGYNGRMVTNSTYNGSLFNADGVKVSKGWYQIDGYYYYVDPTTGSYVRNEARTINGKTYAFDYYGRMVTGDRWEDGQMAVYGPDGVRTSIKDVPNGWTVFDGCYYDYKNGSPVIGWSGDYFLYDDGQMARDTIIDGYYVNNEGKRVKTAGWVENTRYYIKSDGKLAYDEWVAISGSKYYFSGYYYLIGVAKVEDTVYRFDYNGKLLSTLAENPKDGWLKTGSDWAYIRGGSVLRDGTFNIGGTRYFFMNGIMQTNRLSRYYYGECEYFGADGKRVDYTGWQKINGKWYYFSDEHYAVTGWLNNNGKIYYCSPEMVTGDFVYEQKLYVFDANGILQEQIKKDNGWLQRGGKWYYFRNGLLCTNGIYTINGKDYGFSEGVLQKNTVVYSAGDYYYVDGDGVISRTSGWRTVDGERYYFGADGKAVYGVQKIDGKIYYFHGNTL